MLLPTSLLYAFATGHIAVVILLLVYSMIILLKLKFSNVTAQEACPKLNFLVPITVVIHACVSLVVVLVNGYCTLFGFDLLILGWTIYEISRNINTNIYDVIMIILNPVEIDKHIRNNYIRLVYFVTSLLIYTELLIEGLETPIDWNVFNLKKTLFFISTVCITEAVLIILAYSMVKILELELYNSSPRSISQNLNRWLFVKTIIHSVLSCILLVHTSWAFFASNWQILHWEIGKIANKRASRVNGYDPSSILTLTQILKYKSYYKTCFLYFWIFFGVYTYSMLVGNLGVVTTIFLVVVPIMLLMQTEGGFFKLLHLFLTNGQLRRHNADWSCIYTCLSEWAFVFVYCAYLAIWQQYWTDGNKGDWIMYLLLGVFYEFCTLNSIV